MRNSNWHGLMKVLEIQHLGKNGEVLFEQKNILNLLHEEGEEFIVKVLFTGVAIPDNYYLGLDNRTALDESDTLADLISEPSSNGYERQLAGSSDWTVVTNNDGYFQANTPIVTFRATGGNWGPVSNIFLTDTADDSGYLICSAELSSPITVTDGTSISMKLGFAMRDCST